jgi:hypothetical protein
MEPNSNESSQPQVPWQVEAVREVPSNGRGRSLAQLLLVTAVLIGGGVGLAAGGVTLIVGLLSPPPGCDTDGYCHDTLSLATVQTYTGYTFPQGSEVLESTHGTNHFTSISSMTSTVAMPAGSADPTSSDPLSHIRDEGTDDSGRVIVSVSTSDDSDGFPG